jgi:peroxiredoxin
MKRLLLHCSCIFIMHCAYAQPQRVTLAIGSPAPDFSLPGIDGKTYSLASFKDAKILVVIFMCNHCPTSQAYEDRIVQLVNDYKANGVAVVGINPNNPASLRLVELGYSVVGDGFEDMKVRAKDRHFNFPYLYDGETEITSNKYGPVSTPHVFVFDGERKLRYIGRFDDMENPRKTPHNNDTRNAIEALLNNQPVPVETTKVFGCSVKWMEKKDWVEKALIKWANEPVTIAAITPDSIKGLLRNDGDKLRLIHIWTMSNKTSVQQFPDFMTLNHLYRERGLEFVSISTDEAQQKDTLLNFLKAQRASGPNYILTANDKAAITKAVGTSWEATQPYTVLVEPGGKIVYAKPGAINLEQMRKIIFDDAMMGRIYP